MTATLPADSSTERLAREVARVTGKPVQAVVVADNLVGGPPVTSALIAVLTNEPERASFLEKMEEAERCLISALNLYEAQLVALARLGEQGL